MQISDSLWFNKIAESIEPPHDILDKSNIPVKAGQSFSPILTMYMHVIHKIYRYLLTFSLGRCIVVENIGGYFL